MSESIWNVESLKEHLEAIAKEKDRAIDLLARQLESLQEFLKEMRAAANEWRGVINDRDINFVTKDEFLAWKDSAQKALEARKETQDIQAGRGLGLSSSWGILIGCIGLVGGVIGIIATIIGTVIALYALL